jgi:hypothetical protein
MMVFFILWLMIGFLSACGGEGEHEAVTGEDVKEETREAVEAVGAYTEAKKEEYQKKLNAQLDKYEQRLDALRAQGAMMTEEAKNKLGEKLEVLEREKKRLQQKAGELESKSGQAWEDLKNGVDDAMDELDTAFKEATSRFGSSS